MKVYCDMDGVLVDLLSGYKEHCGVCLTEVNHLNDDEKWSKALEVEGFWHKLPVLTGADRLVKFLTTNVYNENLQILSARMNRFETCDVDKIKWVEKNFPSFPVHHANIVNRSEKKDFAVCELGISNILIDDYHKNITEFEKAGGIGIHHIDFETTISELAKLLYS